MIFMTGDIHGTKGVTERLDVKHFPKQRELTKRDYVIVAGDFGLIWDMNEEDRFWLRWLDREMPFTTLFVDGNHENFDLLEQYPVELWKGGKVHKINNSVNHLMRGQVFSIEGRTFFTFGGAASHDKRYRIEGKTWWKREMPSHAEYEEGLRNLDRHNWKVNYIVTHTCSLDAYKWLNSRYGYNYGIDPMHMYLQRIQERLTYDRWHFGHYHQDLVLPQNQRLIYKDLVRIL